MATEKHILTGEGAALELARHWLESSIFHLRVHERAQEAVVCRWCAGIVGALASQHYDVEHLILTNELRKEDK